ncbi:MAG: hypothetical protein ACMUIU_00575 [bacterium]
MKKIYIFSMLLIMGLITNIQAAPITLTFEDLPQVYLQLLPSDYAGLTWENHWAAWYQEDPSKGFFPTSSGNFGIYLHDPKTGWIDFGHEVTFFGSWVASSVDVGQEYYWEGYKNGLKIYESNHLAGGEKDWITVNWSGVDYVNFVSLNADVPRYIIDDIKYSSTSPIPEPSTYLLFFGLVAILMFKEKLYS